MYLKKILLTLAYLTILGCSDANVPTGLFEANSSITNPGVCNGAVYKHNVQSSGTQQQIILCLEENDPKYCVIGSTYPFDCTGNGPLVYNSSANILVLPKGFGITSDCNSSSYQPDFEVYSIDESNIGYITLILEPGQLVTYDAYDQTNWNSAVLGNESICNAP